MIPLPDIYPLMLDGPLEGQEVAWPEGAQSYRAYAELPGFVIPLPGHLLSWKPPEIVTYTRHPFGFRSEDGSHVTLWVAWCGETMPGAEKIAEHLLSDRAKKARTE